MRITCFRWLIEFRQEIFIVIITCVTDFMAGASRGFVAFLVPQLQVDKDSFSRISEEEESWLGSLAFLAMPVGCLIGGISTESFGRKSSLLGMFVPFCAGWTVTAFAKNMMMLYLGTVLNGIAAGMTFCATTYISEICSINHRGPLLNLEETIFSLGAVSCNVIVHCLGWRSSSLYFLVTSVICFFLLFLIPESPNWLVGNGQVKKAVQVLTKIRTTENEVKNEISEMEIHYELVKRSKNSLHSTMKDLVACWKPFLILIGLFLLQQLAGYNILVSYSVIFFKELKLPVDDALLAIVYSATCLVGSFSSPFTALYVGRRSSLAISGLGMSFFVALIALYEMMFYNSVEKPYYWLPLISIYSYCLFCAFGVVTLAFTMGGELFPSHVSGIACGIYGFAGNVLGGVILKLFPYALSTFGIISILWALAVFSFLNVPYAIFILPETRNKTIQQIQKEYFKKKNRHDNRAFIENNQVPC